MRCSDEYEGDDLVIKKAYALLIEEWAKDPFSGFKFVEVNFNDLGGSPQDCPLEEVPRYLNDSLAWNRAYARARLEIGV